MCGKTSTPAEESLQQNQTQLSYAATEMKLDDYFFLDPLFIIGMLVIFVIIVIIVSWWRQRRETLTGSSDEEKNSPKFREGEPSDRNVEVMEGLLSNENDEGKETESLLALAAGRKHATFGPNTKLEDGSEQGSEVNPAEDDKIMTIIPDVDFRDFPKTEEDRMKMRRANMKKMLSLPPLT